MLKSKLQIYTLTSYRKLGMNLVLINTVIKISGMIDSILVAASSTTIVLSFNFGGVGFRIIRIKCLSPTEFNLGEVYCM